MHGKDRKFQSDEEVSIQSSVEEGASPYKVAFNIMKTIIGAGIFSTPYALKQCGFVFGMLLIIPMGALFFWTIMILVRGSIKSETTSMQGLVKFCFGKYGTVFLNLFLLILAWGFLATYTVIIGDEVPSLMVSIIGEPSTEFMKWIMRRRAVVMLASFCVFLPVSMSRSLAGLARYSGIALAGIVFIIGCVVGLAPSVEQSYKGNVPISTIIPSGIPSAMGVIGFAYVCQHNVLLNYSSMKDATPRRFRNVAGISIGVTVVLTLICGCAQIVFREKTTPIILESFSKDDVLINICRLLFAVDMLFTYPLQLFVFRDTINQAFFTDMPFSYIRHTIITVATVGSTCLLACLTCNVGVLLELVGGVTGSVIALVIPCACWIQVHRIRGEPLTILGYLPYVACMIFGIALAILSVSAQVTNQHANKDCKF